MYLMHLNRIVHRQNLPNADCVWANNTKLAKCVGWIIFSPELPTPPKLSYTVCLHLFYYYLCIHVLWGFTIETVADNNEKH